MCSFEGTLRASDSLGPPTNSLLLATGMSWSHIRRRLTGQLDVDDVED